MRTLEGVVVVEGWVVGTSIGTNGSITSAVAEADACVRLG
jgi:hypothetical protein